MISNTTYYDWVPFFNQICASIDAMVLLGNRDDLLLAKAQETFEENHVIFRYGVIDPFSYVYALAQRNTVNQRQAIFSRAITAFNLAISVPTDNIFPTPTPVTPSCFYSEGQYIDGGGTVIGNTCLWNLFHQVFNNIEISESDFNNVLSIRKVGFVKLSQAMFLINPLHFLPFDTQMNSLPDDDLTDLKLVAKRIESGGLSIYSSAIAKIRINFPGCALYEVNLLNVLLNSPNYFDFHVSSRFGVISSYAYGDNDDYFDKFADDNEVWTGGPGSGSGKTIYPLDEFKRGDIVLVRRGRVYLGGIGIIMQNEYADDEGFTDEKAIKVIWLIKDRRRIQDGALGQWAGFSHASANTIRKFENTYPETFRLLRKIQTAQRIMVDHKANRIKNIVLQGPPGTGKTRMAQQIAAWLTSDTPKNQTLIEAIDARVFSSVLAVESDQVKLVQFHPSYSYEDFVRGIKADVNESGHVVYKVENRLLGNLIETASLPENRAKAYVLIIDEMNRANFPSVLGELIYALEYRDKTVTGMYPILLEDGSISSDLLIPDNLYVIGTMNTADRSVGHIDYAIRRRFAFVDVLPDKSPIKSVAQPLFQAVSELFVKGYASIKWSERLPQLEKSDFLAPDFRPEDVWIGHSYFLTSDDGANGKKELETRLKYEIVPILKEYLKDGILLESARKKIEELHA